MADTFFLRMHEVREGIWAFFLIVILGGNLAGGVEGDVCVCDQGH